MNIDIKAIREAAQADIECPREHYEVPMSELQSTVVIALCDEVERVRRTGGRPLAMLGIDQLRDENAELRREVDNHRQSAPMHKPCGRCVVFCQGGDGCHCNMPQISGREREQLVSGQLDQRPPQPYANVSHQ